MEEVIIGFRKGIFEMCLNIPININKTTNTINLNIVGCVSITIRMIPPFQNTVDVYSHSYRV